MIKIANKEREKYLERIASLRRARSGTKLGSWEHKHYSNEIAEAQYQYAQTFKKSKQAKKEKNYNVEPKYRKKGYEVYKNNVYEGFTKNLREAKNHAKKIKGVVKSSKDRRKIIYNGR